MVEVILLESVNDHKAGEIIKVSLGYARNVLFKNKKGIIKNEQNEKRIKSIQKKLALRVAKEKESFEAIKQVLNEKTIAFEAKVHDENKLYGSITAGDIVKKVEELFKLNLEKKQVLLPGHIREIGQYDIKIDLYPEVQAVVKLIITAQKEEPNK
jgi:large subunit ribosomal protein L9